MRAGRHYLGYDTDDSYVRAARARVAEVVRRDDDRPDKAVDAAEALLRSAGFTVARPRKGQRFAGGVDVDLLATDAAAEQWLVLVAGTATVARTGLRRADVLYRVLGEASVLSADGRRVLVLTTDLPPARTTQRAAISAARGRVLTDVISLDAAGAVERLAVYAAGGRVAPVGDLLPG